MLRHCVCLLIITLVLGSAAYTQAQRAGDPVALLAQDGEDVIQVQLGLTPPTQLGERTGSSYATGSGPMQIVMQMIGRDQLRVQITTRPGPWADRIGIALHAVAGEQFVGLTERVVDGPDSASWAPNTSAALDLRGQRFEMLVRGTLGLYSPFYLSTEHYGVYVEGTWPGSFDMCLTKPDQVWILFDTPELTLHIFRGTPIQIMRAHRKQTSMPYRPPRWAFKPWRWRDEHTQRNRLYDGTPYQGPYNAEVVEDILMMEALGIPCGVYWIDRPWADGKMGYESLTWDQKRFPHAQKMIAWLEDRDTRCLLWLAPWIVGDRAAQGAKPSYFLPTTVPDDDPRRLLDFSNPDAVAWWRQHLERLISQGIAGFKLDRADEIVPSTTDARAHSGQMLRELHNDYPRLYLAAANATFVPHRPNDFICMARAGYTGSWNLGAAWGGDTAGTEWGLRSAIIAVQRAAVMGYSLWGSDTGGYHQGYNRETMARWLAFSAFCPIMEVGPTANKSLWNAPWEPSYDAELLAIWSLYAQVHEALGDYLFSWSAQGAFYGEPLVRPLWVQFRDDVDARQHWDQYMLGPYILVCPIWKSDQRQHSVYLPEGRWRDLWDHETIHEGPLVLTVDTPLHKIPLYVSADIDLALPALNELYNQAKQRTAQPPDLKKLLQEAGFE